MPSQKQLQWSQLKVGITVVVAALTLAVLILLMSGASDLFRRKLILRTYFSDANGLLEGAPVRLQGVTVGKVSEIRVVADPSRKLAPIEVTMEIGYRFRANLRTDSVTTLATEGILGETYIDIDSSQSKGRRRKMATCCQLVKRPNWRTLFEPARVLLRILTR